MTAREFQQLPLLVHGGHPAERIRRRCVQQHARAWGDGGFERREIDLITIADEWMRDLHGRGVEHRDIRRSVGPRRRQHQRFIARIENAANADVERLDTGCRDDNLAGRIQLHALQLLVITRQRLAQRRQAGVFGVEREAVRHGLLRRTLDVFRRRQIRFAEIKFQYTIHPHCDFGEFADAGVWNAQRGGCEGSRHAFSSLDSFEDCGNRGRESGQDIGVFEHLILLELL